MNLLVAPLYIPLGFALLGLLFHRCPRWRNAIGLASAIALVAATVRIFQHTLTGEVHFLALGGWVPPFGITLVADVTSALFLLTCAFTALCVALHAAFNKLDEPLDKWFFPMSNFLLLGVNGSLLTGDIFNLFVWFEVMLIASFVLMVIGGKRSQLEGGLKYVVINLVGSALFLAGIGIIYGKTGSLNFADIALKMQIAENPQLMRSSVALLLASFAIKAGLFPFFFWLPASYHTPQPIVTALFAGLLTKVGVYAFFRVASLFLGPDFAVWQPVVMWIAALTMITGVLGAAAQFEMRKILAFHIISQIGYLIAGFAMFTKIGIAAALFYFVHNNLAKTNLLLVAAWVQQRTGTGDLARLGGFYKAAPAVSVLFLISALALAGIPPLSGFWAKLGIVRAGLDGHFWWLTAAALAVGMWTLFSMTKIWAEVFWKPAPDPQIAVPSDKCPSIIAIAFMVGAILLLSFAGEPVFSVAMLAAEQLLNPQIYIESILAGGVR